MALDVANAKAEKLDPKHPVRIPTAEDLSLAEKAQEKNFKELFDSHTEHADRMEADECFHKLSHGNGIDDLRYLDHEHLETAIDDVFSKWDISLTEDGEKAFKKNHFEPAWHKFNKDGKVEYG